MSNRTARRNLAECSDMQSEMATKRFPKNHNRKWRRQLASKDHISTTPFSHDVTVRGICLRACVIAEITLRNCEVRVMAFGALYAVFAGPFWPGGRGVRAGRVKQGKPADVTLLQLWPCVCARLSVCSLVSVFVYDCSVYISVSSFIIIF